MSCSSRFARKSDIDDGKLEGSSPDPAYSVRLNPVFSCDWSDIVDSLPSFSDVSWGLGSLGARSGDGRALEKRRVCRTTGSIKEERSPLIESQMRSKPLGNLAIKIQLRDSWVLCFALALVLCEVLRNRIERHVTCPFRSAADSRRENIFDMQCSWVFTENFVACYFTDVLRGMYWGFYAQGAIWSAHLLLLWQPPDVTRMYIVHSSMPPCPSCEDRMKLACVMLQSSSRHNPGISIIPVQSRAVEGLAPASNGWSTLVALLGAFLPEKPFAVAIAKIRCSLTIIEHKSDDLPGNIAFGIC